MPRAISFQVAAQGPEVPLVAWPSPLAISPFQALFLLSPAGLWPSWAGPGQDEGQAGFNWSVPGAVVPFILCLFHLFVTQWWCGPHTPGPC